MSVVRVHVGELEKPSDFGPLGESLRALCFSRTRPSPTSWVDPWGTAVSQRGRRPVLEGDKRLLARGPLSIEKDGIALEKACVDADVPEFRPGQLRHSVAAGAINQGEDPVSGAAFLAPAPV